jgi:hypothetical protein
MPRITADLRAHSFAGTWIGVQLSPGLIAPGDNSLGRDRPTLASRRHRLRVQRSRGASAKP